MIMSFELSKNREERLRRIQEKIAKKVILIDRFRRPVRTVAGFDLAFLDEEAFAVGVVLDYKSFRLEEMKMMRTDLSFPYIPTLLSFREGPPIMKVYKKLKTKPDILMINGCGINHPIMAGLATHVGVLLNKPTIGITQSNLCSEYRKYPEKVGGWGYLYYQNRRVGYILKTKRGCSPIYIAPGHRVSLGTSLRIVKSCIKDHKIPEPVFLAHSFAEGIKISTRNK